MIHNIDNLVETDLNTALTAADLIVINTNACVFIQRKMTASGFVFTATLEQNVSGWELFIPVLPVCR